MAETQREAHVVQMIFLDYCVIRCEWEGERDETSVADLRCSSLCWRTGKPPLWVMLGKQKWQPRHVAY